MGSTYLGKDLRPCAEKPPTRRGFHAKLRAKIARLIRMFHLSSKRHFPSHIGRRTACDGHAICLSFRTPRCISRFGTVVLFLAAMLAASVLRTPSIRAIRLVLSALCLPSNSGISEHPAAHALVLPMLDVFSCARRRVRHRARSSQWQPRSALTCSRSHHPLAHLVITPSVPKLGSLFPSLPPASSSFLRPRAQDLPLYSCCPSNFPLPCLGDWVGLSQRASYSAQWRGSEDARPQRHSYRVRSLCTHSRAVLGHLRPSWIYEPSNVPDTLCPQGLNDPLVCCL